MKFYFDAAVVVGLSAPPHSCGLLRTISTQAALLALAGVLALGSAAHASIINVDINTASASAGNGVLRSDGSTNLNPSVGSSTGTWNEIVGSPVGNPSYSISYPTTYVDSTGAPTSLTVSLSDFNQPGNTPPDAGYAAAPGFLGNFMLEVDPTTASVTIGGLAHGGTYNLYLYATNDGGGAGATFTVNSVSQTTTGDYYGAFNTPGYSSGNNFTEFTAVANGSGVLVVTVAGAGGASNFPGGGGDGLGILNGFQLVSVPEPASWMLFGLGAAGLFVAAHRRRKD